MIPEGNPSAGVMTVSPQRILGKTSASVLTAIERLASGCWLAPIHMRHATGWTAGDDVIGFFFF
ncbi:hypothetical protein [uncultured Bacteroides sp.]|uniref:hypothetical protein n=1 Tax=uncultured Bacteroides sp. TaxID=162156 RepID=UPI00260E9FC6|nr:hypothetical protein [uncultured Bacteroides sp.]